MKIGVFDSGIGGKAIAENLRHEFSGIEIVYVDDAIHVPYGDRSADEIILLTDAAIQPLLSSACEIIVLACNSATAAAIETLRARYPSHHFVGLEPMVKTAATLTKTNVVAICATPFTLSSQRYQTLKAKYATDIVVLEPDCSEWASMIEDNTVNDWKIAQTIHKVCNDGADVIVLACTHYHWIKKQIQSLADEKAIVIDPSDAINRRVRYIIDHI
jgi:glutamate racemase